MTAVLSQTTRVIKSMTAVLSKMSCVIKSIIFEAIVPLVAFRLWAPVVLPPWPDSPRRR
jgi:hypothetical protein